MTTDSPYDLLTRAEAAEILRCHVQTVSRMVGDGRLHAVRLGREIRIPRGSLRSCIRGEERPALPADHWPPTAPLW